MATQLVIGQNLVVPSGTISVDLRTRTEALFIAFCLDADNQVSNEQDCVYYGNPTTDFGSVSCDSSANNAAFSIDLASISPQIQKIATCADESSVVMDMVSWAPNFTFS